MIWQGFLRRLRHFRDNEFGGGTIWALFWFVLLAGFGGIAVDVSNAHRMEAIMQITADAIAHNAVLDLPDEDAAELRALATAEAHMPANGYGAILASEDVEFGIWDRDTRTFTEPGVGQPPDAIRVTLRSTSANANPVDTFLLRIAGFDAWEIRVTSIALLDWEPCYLDGLISASQVVMSSTNEFLDFYCVYGRDGIELVNGNDFTGDLFHAYAGYSTGVTHECGFFLMGTQGSPPHCNMGSNPGLVDAQFVSDDVHPTRLYLLDANGDPVFDMNGNPIVTLPLQIQDIVTEAQAGTHLTEAQWRGSQNKPTAAVSAQLQAGGAFYLECADDRDKLELGGGDYYNLVLATNCLLELPGGSATNPNIYENVTFVSTSTRSFNASGFWNGLDHNILVRGGNILGTGCSGNTGAAFFSESGVKFDGGNEHMGTVVNAGGSVGIDGDHDASSTPEHSITVHALGDIKMTSNSTFSICDRDGVSQGIIPLPVLVN